jgi:TP901 family phage tail tape measure protein
VAEVIRTNIDVAINTSKAAAELKKLQTQINAFNLTLNRGSVDQLDASKRWASGLSDIVNNTQFFRAETVKMQTSAGALDSVLKRGSATMGQFFSAAFNRRGTMFAETTALASERVRTLQTQFIATSKASGGMQDALAIRPLSAFSSQASIAAQRMTILSAMFKQGTTNLINFGKNVQWAGRQLMVGFTVPLTIFGTAATKVFRDLETEVVNFKKVYGDLFTTDLEVETNLNAVRELSKEFTKYGIAAKETMMLAAIGAQAGKEGAELQAATIQATRLSVLGDIDRQTAMKTTIALQSAFKLSNEELANSINFLNLVENSSVVSLQNLTDAIPRVAPVIVGLGGDIKDMAVFLAAMQEGGVNAAEAANGLKSSLGRLISPTKQAKEMANEFGISLEKIVEVNEGNVLGMVISLSESMKQLTDLQKQQLLSAVFGKFQFARMGALFENITKEGSQASRIIEMMDTSIEDLAATADKELGAIENSIGTQLTAAIERFKLELAPVGEIFAKIAIPLLNFATKILEAFNSISDSKKNLLGIAALVVGVVVPAFTMFFGLIMNLLGNLSKFGQLIFGFFTNLARKGPIGAVKSLTQSTKYLSLAEIDAANAARQLGSATEITNAALLKQAGAGNSATAAINALTASYRLLVAEQARAVATQPALFATGRSIVGRSIVGRPLPIVKRNKGGEIFTLNQGNRVPGVGNTDTVPAMLTPGEFVVNKESTQNNLDVLKAINSGTPMNLGGQMKGGILHAMAGAVARSFGAKRVSNFIGAETGAFAVKGRPTTRRGQSTRTASKQNIPPGQVIGKKDNFVYGFQPLTNQQLKGNAIYKEAGFDRMGVPAEQIKKEMLSSEGMFFVDSYAGGPWNRKGYEKAISNKIDAIVANNPGKEIRFLDKKGLGRVLNNPGLKTDPRYKDIKFLSVADIHDKNVLSYLEPNHIQRLKKIETQTQMLARGRSREFTAGTPMFESIDMLPSTYPAGTTVRVGDQFTRADLYHYNGEKWNRLRKIEARPTDMSIGPDSYHRWSKGIKNWRGEKRPEGIHASHVFNAGGMVPIQKFSVGGVASRARDAVVLGMRGIGGKFTSWKVRGGRNKAFVDEYIQKYLPANQRNEAAKIIQAFSEKLTRSKKSGKQFFSRTAKTMETQHLMGSELNQLLKNANIPTFEKFIVEKLGTEVHATHLTRAFVRGGKRKVSNYTADYDAASNLQANAGTLPVEEFIKRNLSGKNKRYGKYDKIIDGSITTKKIEEIAKARGITSKKLRKEIEDKIDEAIKNELKKYKGRMISDDPRGTTITFQDVVKPQIDRIILDDYGGSKNKLKELATRSIVRRNKGGMIPGFNEGNIVPGVGNTDTVPAMLTPGEFVINKESTKQNYDLLTAINNGMNVGGKVKGYNAGGMAEGVQFLYGGGVARFAKGINSKLSNTILPSQLPKREYSRLVKSIFERRNAKVPGQFGDDLIPVHKIKGSSFAFQGVGDDFSQLASQGITPVKTNPQGLLEAAIKLNPKDKGLQAMLKNVQDKKFGSSETQLLDEIGAAVSIGRRGNVSQVESVDGFAMVLASLSGNKNAKRILNEKTNILNSLLPKTKKVTKTESPDFQDIAAIHNSKYPIVRDAKGNITIHPAGYHEMGSMTRNYPYSRSSVHFTLEAPVKSHNQGKFSSKDNTIVTKLSSIIDDSGLPMILNATDTWWMKNVGEGIKLSKASVVRPITSKTQYLLELEKRGLISPGKKVPVITVDPKTDDVLYHAKKLYNQSERVAISKASEGLMISRFSVPKLGDKSSSPQMVTIDPLDATSFKGYESELLDIVSIQIAKKRMGINTGPEKLGTYGLESEVGIKKLDSLSKKYKLNTGTHTGTPQQIAEGSSQINNPSRFPVNKDGTIEVNKGVSAKINSGREAMRMATATGTFGKNTIERQARISDKDIGAINKGGLIPKKFNDGNIVPGVGNTDTVPAMLTPGEFVINKESTAKNLELLHAINDGSLAGYNKGGRIKNGILYAKKGEGPVKPTASQVAERFRGIQGNPVKPKPVPIRGAGPIGMAAGLAASIPLFSEGAVENLGMSGSMIASMVAFVGVQKVATGLINKFGSSLKAGAASTSGVATAASSLQKSLFRANVIFRAALIPVLGPIAAIALATIGVFTMFGKTMEKIRKSGEEFNNAMFGSSESLKNMAKAVGRATPSEQMARQSAEILSGARVTQEDIEFSSKFMQTEESNQLLKDLETVKKMGGDQAKALKNQLGQAVLSGIFTPEEAKQIAVDIGLALKNEKLSVDAVAQLTNLFGPDGKKLENNKIQILTEISAPEDIKTIVQQSERELERIQKAHFRFWEKGTGFDSALAFQKFFMLFEPDKEALELSMQMNALQNNVIENLAKEKQLRSQIQLELQNGVISLEKYNSIIDTLNQKTSRDSITNAIRATGISQEELSRLKFNAPAGAIGTGVLGTGIDPLKTLGAMRYGGIEKNIGLSREAKELENLTERLKDAVKIDLEEAGFSEDEITRILTKTSERFGKSLAEQAYLFADILEGRISAAAFGYVETVRDSSPDFDAGLRALATELGLIKTETVEVSPARTATSVNQSGKKTRVIPAVTEQVEIDASSAEAAKRLDPFMRSPGLLAAGKTAIARESSKGDTFPKPLAPGQMSAEDGFAYAERLAEGLQLLQTLPTDLIFAIKVDIDSPIDIFKYDGQDIEAFKSSWSALDALDPALDKTLVFQSIGLDSNGQPRPIGDVVKDAIEIQKAMSGLRSEDKKVIREAELKLVTLLNNNSNLTPEEIANQLDTIREKYKDVWDSIDEGTKVSMILLEMRINGLDDSDPEERRIINELNQRLLDMYNQAQIAGAAVKKEEGGGGSKSKSLFERIKEEEKVAKDFVKNMKKLSSIGGVGSLAFIEKVVGEGEEGLKLLKGGGKKLKAAFDAYRNTMIQGVKFELNVSVPRQIKELNQLEKTRTNLINQGLIPAAAQELDMEYLLFLSREKNSKQVKKYIKVLNDLYNAKNRKTGDEALLENLNSESSAILYQIGLQERKLRSSQNQITEIEKQNQEYGHQIDLYSKGLEKIAEEEEKINEQYNLRIEALNKVQKANERAANLSKQQVDLASALASGDIAAAAKISQDITATRAQNRLEDARGALEEQRQKRIESLTISVNGQLLTRKQIEESIKNINDKIWDNNLNIYNIRKSMEPIENRILQLQREQLAVQDAIADAQERQRVAAQNTASGGTTGGGTTSSSTKNGPQPDAGSVATKLWTDIQNIKNKTKRESLEKLFNEYYYNQNKVAGVYRISDGEEKDIRRRFMYGGVAYRGSRQAPPSLKMAYGSIVPGIGLGDKVPALLTPGEFVVRKSAAQAYMPLLESINSDVFPRVNFNGAMPKSSANNNSSMYNNYSVNVNVAGTNSSPDDIANAVMEKIKRIESRNIRSAKYLG